MALKGLKVVEFAGLAPAPFCGMIFSDFGAKVVRVDKARGTNPDQLSRGKLSLAVDLKKPEGVKVVRKLCSTADVLIEPYRPGGMEKLGLGPKELLQDNPKLIYARLTGYGQTGPFHLCAGHDINYLAISGLLHRLGRAGERPHAPINLMADFAGGGLLCALGITMALFNRNVTGAGQVIDSNMVEGASYVGSFVYQMLNSPIFTKNRGEGWLDGGAPFYDTYKTKDDKYMAVGAIEDKFYENFLKGTGQGIEGTTKYHQNFGILLGKAEHLYTLKIYESDYLIQDILFELYQGLGLDPFEYKQHPFWDKNRQKFTEIFASKTQEEWCHIFDGVDACVTPVLSVEEAASHRHNVARGTFYEDDHSNAIPNPAPILQSSPGIKGTTQQPVVGQHSMEILHDIGYDAKECELLLKSGAVNQYTQSHL